jgi:hypothetical protein
MKKQARLPHHLQPYRQSRRRRQQQQDTRPNIDQQPE